MTLALLPPSPSLAATVAVWVVFILLVGTLSLSKGCRQCGASLACHSGYLWGCRDYADSLDAGTRFIFSPCPSGRPLIRLLVLAFIFLQEKNGKDGVVGALSLAVALVGVFELDVSAKIGDLNSDLSDLKRDLRDLKGDIRKLKMALDKLLTT